MAENKIELKSVNELLGMKFFIPSYQRGYRWTEQQVKDLLNDVNEFIQNKNSDFYSLQPLVVKKRWPEKALEEIKGKTSIEEIENYINKCEWEVIDGQQRLTTIYIILKYLGFEKSYGIDYQTRGKFGSFLDTIKDKTIASDNLNDAYAYIIKDYETFDNIDFYHVFTSYSTIKHWFEVEHKDDEKVKKKDFISHLLKNVKFIWYESVGEDPIKVFTRLNIGKIKLTNSELIKALMLNRSNFKDESSRHIQLRQQEIASEWDNIEYTLQNDEFWLFLHEKDYRKPTRIDFIFDLICEENPFKVGITNIGSDDYKTFVENHFRTIDITDGYILEPNDFVRGHSAETVSLPSFINGIIVNRNSLCSVGLDVSISQYINPSYKKNKIIVIRNISHNKIKIKSGLRICQLVLFRMQSESIRDYSNRHSLESLKGFIELKNVKTTQNVDHSLSDFMEKRINDIALGEKR